MLITLCTFIVSCHELPKLKAVGFLNYLTKTMFIYGFCRAALLPNTIERVFPATQSVSGVD